MTVTEIADEIQAQLSSAVQTVQQSVVSTLEWVGEQAQTLLPQTTARLVDRLPQATEYVDRGFETAEQWLRSQHDFVSKIANALQPSA
jgi:hypothetical protein